MRQTSSKQKLLIIVVGLTIAVAAGAGAPPAKMVLDRMKNLYAGVQFQHTAHFEMGFACSDCHHVRFGTPLTCSKCHDHRMAPDTFVHEHHWESSKCESCHQVSSSKELACSSCHKVPFDENNLQLLGLKGALHKQCMACHAENGAPNGCTDCHARVTPAPIQQ